MKFLKIIALLLLIVLPKINAQQKTVNKVNEQWMQYYNQTKLNDKWTLNGDIGFRWRDGFDENSLYIVRVGANYKFNKTMGIAAGIAHLGFYAEDKINRLEIRPYQEFNMTNTSGKVSVLHRFRVEERIFYPVIDGKILSTNDFNFRFRYRFMLNIPVFNLSSKDADQKVYLNLGDEIMINAGKNIVYNTFDQNRILIGANFQVDKNLGLALTYNNQFSATKKAANYNHTNVIWLQITQKIDASKKK